MTLGDFSLKNGVWQVDVVEGAGGAMLGHSGHRTMRWWGDEVGRRFSVGGVEAEVVKTWLVAVYIYYGRKKYCRHFFLTAEIEKALTFFL